MFGEAQSAHLKRVLNTGSGPFNPLKLHPAFRTGGWHEVRLDIDARLNPDLVGSVFDMRALVPDASFDAIWSSHNVEHLHTHEVLPAFRELRRVLKPDGFALITCPDLQAIASLVLEGKAEATIYTAPAGPISTLDMLYGHSQSIASGGVYMAHNTGFTADRMARVCLDAGFAEVRTTKGGFFDLWALALMPEARSERLEAIFAGTEQRALTQ
ncbi:class I SAM-dependent methyltransferase [Methylobacterium sp. J-026]|uniref:class I SAM-dependent methyltransferase n=1 Tax=Methylobacterium sp. J-026 TaxID=2836624 RepID=UPI001FBA6318|nr:methyltransferase domain-containing protein [Methylobacterium sp. J-026]MCJ2134015.1 class I SAM-dependent methyltransferase [Methylobacterium sp. J-026]